MPSADRILVVEDERVLAQNVKAYLSRRCPDVRIAADGRRAMEMVASFSPDVVVLDYGLPWKNGLQFYREMVRRGAHLPACVMITGYPLENLAPPASRAGIHYLLCKPFSLADLQHLIDRSAEEASRVWH